MQLSAPRDTAVILDTATLCCGDCLDLLPIFPEMDHFLGFDSDTSYLPIATARISHAINSYKLSAIQQALPNLL